MKKTVKYGLIIAGIGFAAAVAVFLYMYNMPHRNIQEEEVRFTMGADEFTQEFMSNPVESNAKYLDQVVVIEGIIGEKSQDQLNQQVITFKTEKAGINCTFTAETNSNAEKLNEGYKVKIKGVVRLGASYDEDLDMTEYAILEKCDIIK